MIFYMGGFILHRIRHQPEKAKPFVAVAHCTVKKEPGNPDKDLGTSSVTHNERRRATYAILRIWLCLKTTKSSYEKPDM